MDADVLDILKSKTAYICDRDRNGILSIIIPVPSELKPNDNVNLKITINYLMSSLSDTTRENGFSCLVDATKSSLRQTQTYLNTITEVLGTQLKTLIVLRPDAFWNKQRIESCIKTHKENEAIIIPKSSLTKHYDLSQLPVELGGTIAYDHEVWLQARTRFEDIRQHYENVNKDVDHLHTELNSYKAIRLNEIRDAFHRLEQLNREVQRKINILLDKGTVFLASIRENPRLIITQDLLEARDLVKSMLKTIDANQFRLQKGWIDLEQHLEDAKKVCTLEQGVMYVTNWIMKTADVQLNEQLTIGNDLQMCDRLWQEHELFEINCTDTYGMYAELLHKINDLKLNMEIPSHKDLNSQKEFMDFICRSFAARLERRRNILITSSRFHRFTIDYFTKTNEIFESMIMGNKLSQLDTAASKLKKLKLIGEQLENTGDQLIKEGEKLTDLLSMPIKDALGREINVNYSDEIDYIQEILSATGARRNLFNDSVELEKLTLEQAVHIHSYENDAKIAIEWISDLNEVLLRSHSHVGVNMSEIQKQKDDLQCFQETIKSIYDYGCQLLDAALSLRQTCKLSITDNMLMSQEIHYLWKHIQLISQEQMTRLRVSAVFHRSVEEQCKKLDELIQSIRGIGSSGADVDQQRNQLRKQLTSREKLLMDIGRMVRLGKLLRVRLKEPFLSSTENSSETSTSKDKSACDNWNNIACNAINDKLQTVMKDAEQLDTVVKQLTIIEEKTDDTQLKYAEKHRETNSSGNDSKGSADEWSTSMRSTEDESFVTASEGTLRSGSSVYHTASDGDSSSPWWNNDRSPPDLSSSSESDTLSPHPVLGSQSTSILLDDSEESFGTAHESHNSSTNSELNTEGSVAQDSELNGFETTRKPPGDVTVVQDSTTAWHLLSKHTIKSCL